MMLGNNISDNLVFHHLLHGAMSALLQEDRAVSLAVLVAMMLDLSANLLNEEDMNMLVIRM